MPLTKRKPPMNPEALERAQRRAAERKHVTDATDVTQSSNWQDLYDVTHFPYFTVTTSRHLGYYLRVRHDSLTRKLRGKSLVDHFNGKFTVPAYELTKADCIRLMVEMNIKRTALLDQLLQNIPVADIKF